MVVGLRRYDTALSPHRSDRTDHRLERIMDGRLERRSVFPRADIAALHDTIM